MASFAAAILEAVKTTFFQRCVARDFEGLLGKTVGVWWEESLKLGQDPDFRPRGILPGVTILPILEEKWNLFFVQLIIQVEVVYTAIVAISESCD